MRISVLSAIAVAAALFTSAGSGNAQERRDDEPSPTTNVPAAERADRPLLADIPEPALAVEGGAGVIGFVGGAASLGPTWNARVTASFTPRWAAEANYLGALNERQDNNATMLTTQIDGSVRYNILRGREAPVQPFVTAGLGYAGFSGDDGDMGAIVVPIGGGVERMLTPNIKAGARVSYRPVFFEDLSTPLDRIDDESGPGGDTFAILAHVGGAF